MLAQQDRPTPVPTGDDEDDATRVWQESPIVDGGAGMAAMASTPTGAAVHDRQTLTEPRVDVRDTIVGSTALPLLLRLKVFVGVPGHDLRGRAYAIVQASSGRCR